VAKGQRQHERYRDLNRPVECVVDVEREPLGEVVLGDDAEVEPVLSDVDARLGHHLYLDRHEQRQLLGPVRPDADVGGGVALLAAHEARLHHRLRLVGRDLLRRGSGEAAPGSQLTWTHPDGLEGGGRAVGQLQVQVAAARENLGDLERGAVRVVDVDVLDERAVHRHLGADEGSQAVGVRRAHTRNLQRQRSAAGPDLRENEHATVTLRLKTPADEWTKSVFSMRPSCRGRKTTSKVVEAPASTILCSKNEQ